METAEEILRRGLDDLRLEAPEETVSTFLHYMEALKRWNQAYNLTAVRDDRAVIRTHFLDSLLYLQLVPPGPWSVCDVGSGAGFPGVPMALLRKDLSLCLIEPSRKKTAFLRHLSRTLPLPNVDIVEARVEHVQERRFDIAVARALASVAEIIHKARHVLKPAGFFILSKGPRYQAELQKLPKNMPVLMTEANLPGTGQIRILLRVSPTPIPD